MSLAFFLTALGLATIWIFYQKSKVPIASAPTRAPEALADKRLPPESLEFEPAAIDKSVSPKERTFERATDKTYAGTLTAREKQEKRIMEREKRKMEKAYAEKLALKQIEERKRYPLPPDGLPPGMTPEAWVFNKKLEAMRPQFAAERKELHKRMKIDRERYVRPAPPGFKPEPAARKIKITLFLEKNTLRLDKRHVNQGPLRYRVEIQNVGSKDVTWIENTSFIKTGYISGIGDFSFRVISPGGKESELERPVVVGGRLGSDPITIPGFEAMSDEEKRAAIKKDLEESKTEDELFVKLRPGEVLFSRAWKEPGLFHEYMTAHHFEPFRTYGIKLVFTDSPPDPPDEDAIQRSIRRGISREKKMKWHQQSVERSFGLVESNVVRIKTLP